MIPVTAMSSSCCRGCPWSSPLCSDISKHSMYSPRPLCWRPMLLCTIPPFVQASGSLLAPSCPCGPWTSRHIPAPADLLGNGQEVAGWKHLGLLSNTPFCLPSCAPPQGPLWEEGQGSPACKGRADTWSSSPDCEPFLVVSDSFGLLCLCNPNRVSVDTSYRGVSLCSVFLSISVALFIM